MAASITFDIIARDRATTTMDRVKRSAAVVGAAIGALAVKVGRDSVKAYVEAEQSQIRLQTALAKFPRTADTNIDRLNKFNAALAQKTRFDDDATASGQAVLAQFGVTGRQLERLTPLLQDYAAKTGKELPTAAADLGRAILGQGRALKTVGLNFEDTGSKAGNLDQLMSGLRSQVGGFATKEGQTASGQAAILSNQFGELQESIGAALVPALTALAQGLLSVIRWMQENSTAMKVILSVAGAAAVAIMGLVVASKIHAAVVAIQTSGTFAYAVAQKAQAVASKVATAAQWAWNAALSANPIGLVVVAVAALVGGLVLAYKRSETFRNVVKGAFDVVKNAGEAMWDALRAAFTFITKAWLSVAGAIINGAAKMFGWVPGVGGKLKSAAAAFNEFRAGVEASLSGVGAAGAKAGADFVRGVAEGIRATTGLAVGAAGDMSNRIAAQARDVLQERSPSRVGKDIGANFATGVALGVKGRAKAAVDEVEKLARDLIKAGRKAELAGMTKRERRKDRLGNRLGRELGQDNRAAEQAAAKVSRIADRDISRVQAWFQGLAETATAAVDAAANKLGELKSLRDSAFSSVSGAISGIFDAGSLAGGNMVGRVQTWLADVRNFVAELRGLSSKGLPGSLVQQVAALGPIAGLEAARALNSLDVAGAQAVSSAFGEIGTLATEGGTIAMNLVVPPAVLAAQEAQVASLTLAATNIQTQGANAVKAIETARDLTLAKIEKDRAANEKLLQAAIDALSQERLAVIERKGGEVIFRIVQDEERKAARRR